MTETEPATMHRIYGIVRCRLSFDDAKETLERWVLQELQPVRVVEEVSR